MENYNKIQIFLHDLFLKNKFLNKSLFEIEKIFFLRKQYLLEKKHIFISSLARSGTTSLLNFIFSTNKYASLTYKNMPYVLSPNISKFLNKKKIIKKKERLHGDGINYDIDSPESFDEIFFSENENFVNEELQNFLQLICKSEKKTRYLSKNNLNYKRIDFITSLLPKSIFLITIREPLQHSYSLLNQHILFSKLQKKNSFIKRYMNYLGHNEFGMNHIYWNKPVNFANPNDINYWIEQWILFYSNIYKNYNTNNKCVFIVYEKLSDPIYLKSLLKRIGLINEKINLNYFKNSNKNINVSYDFNVYKESVNIYKKFINFKL